MPDQMPTSPDPSGLRQRVLSRWDDEGGAARDGPQERTNASAPRAVEEPRLTNAELVQLRVRVIALENLVIALLCEGSDRQVALARKMADYISPRPGFTHHPLTIHAARHMIDLVERAGCFRTADSEKRSPVREADRDG